MLRRVMVAFMAAVLTSAVLGICLEQRLFDIALWFVYRITDDMFLVVHLFYASKAAMSSLVPTSVAIAVYASMRGTASPYTTVCRKCGYTLRGISEPRCPECGERI